MRNGRTQLTPVVVMHVSPCHTCFHLMFSFTEVCIWNKIYYGWRARLDGSRLGLGTWHQPAPLAMPVSIHIFLHYALLHMADIRIQYISVILVPTRKRSRDSTLLVAIIIIIIIIMVHSDLNDRAFSWGIYIHI